MYSDLPGVSIPYIYSNMVLATVLATACTVAAAYIACMNELKSNPAVLMRPAAPRAGKRIFLEYIGFIWNHMSFTMKSTMRNLFRYKKRFFMTVIGIAGCMALLLVGFGIKDSIGVLSDRQYKELWLMDASISFKSDTSDEEKEQLLNMLKSDLRIKEAVLVNDTSCEFTNEDVIKSAGLVVLNDTESFSDFYCFRNRLSGAGYSITDSGVLVTEKFAKQLGVSAGDSITLIIDNSRRVDITVTAVVENYTYHKVFMTKTLYKELFGKECEYNACYYTDNELTVQQEEQLVSDVLADNSIISSVILTGQLRETIDDMVGSLNIIVYVLIVSAGLLSFVVLYNLNNINIAERKRELATLKVLGFYPAEVNAYVYRENIFLTAIGMVAGIAFGIVLHRFVMTTCEIDMFMFGRTIDGISYVYSMILTIVFSVFACFITSFSLKNIDMAQSLKSIE